MPSLTLARTVGLSILLHVGFLIYGALQDRHPVVKFTDIDYLVFSDGALFVSQNLSPYLRATYRYTPVLAWLVVPNVLHPVWGKLLFCACNLVTGCVMHHTLVARGMQGARAAKYAAVWLLNPFVVAISTRGNAESVVSVLVMTTLWALVARRRRLAAVLFGVGVHFKVFPIIYALPIWLMLQAGVGKAQKMKTRSANDVGAAIRSFFNPVRYGSEFLHETYLYHITRKDHRHNFSLYFYHMYLSSVLPASAQGAAAGVFVSILSFLPQLGLVSVLGAMLAKDIAMACFAQTFAFVMLNKVCTSQAYRLEHLGHNTFRELWAASAVFYLVNAVTLAAFVRYHRFEPVFDSAGAVRQVFHDGRLRQRQAGPLTKPPRMPSKRSKDPLPALQFEETRTSSPTSTSPSRKNEPPPPPELVLEETYLGQGLVRFTVKRNKPSGSITALDVLAGVCGVVLFVQMYNGRLPALPISLLLLFFSGLRVASRMQTVRHESITFMESFGITLEQAAAFGKKQTFIPLTDIINVVINEAITRWTIKYYLAIIVKDKPELVVVFEVRCKRSDCCRGSPG
ncbi:hypothetical protein HDU87_006138 [Geranomyces variabilis]|uniref:GPI mannosyltransferase 1 n=1 Tax=Geranomyces variabilis TaxID=109894 RepID=A0AAD5THD6_9FUNG|nr:hypothetical protein HDU87_006138 [Geranomyces variabilis]